MILYYSATGNTKWVAQQLSTFLCDERLYAFSKVEPDLSACLQPGESLGLCFPIHAWGMPQPVLEVVKQIVLPPSTYVYSVCTCGDDCGKVHRQLSRVLKKKKQRLSFMASVAMPNTYINLPGFDVDSEEVQQRKCLIARERLPQLAERIRNREVAKEVTEGWFPRLKSSILRWFFRRYLVNDAYFSVSTERCVGCGKCVQKCPMQNMLMENGKPLWLHGGSCNTCMACYHHCPVQAIRFGRYTEGKGQYYFKKNEQKQ